MQVARDRRECRGDDRLVERGEKHAEHQRPRITRIRWCSALLISPVSVTATEPGPSCIKFPQVPVDVAGELAEQPRELDLLRLGPAGKKSTSAMPGGRPETGRSCDGP